MWTADTMKATGNALASGAKLPEVLFHVSSKFCRTFKVSKCSTQDAAKARMHTFLAREELSCEHLTYPHRP